MTGYTPMVSAAQRPAAMRIDPIYIPVFTMISLCVFYKHGAAPSWHWSAITASDVDAFMPATPAATPGAAAASTAALSRSRQLGEEGAQHERRQRPPGDGAQGAR